MLDLIDRINAFTLKKKNLVPIGPIVGSGGVIMLNFSLYNDNKNEKYLNLMEEFVDDSIDKIEKSTSPYCFNDFSLGNLGLFWMLTYLRNENIIHRKLFDSFDEINSYLLDYSGQYLSDKKLNYFHGYGGILFYFLELKDSSRLSYLMKNLNFHFSNYGIEQNFKVDGKLNLSTPYGIVGFALIIFRITKLYPTTQNVQLLRNVYRLIDKEVHEVIANENFSECELGDFGWCKGKIMGIAFLKLCNINFSFELKDYFLDMYLKSLIVYLNEKAYLVSDLSIGYGLAGIIENISYINNITDQKCNSRSTYKLESLLIQGVNKKRSINLLDLPLITGVTGSILTINSLEVRKKNSWKKILLQA